MKLCQKCKKEVLSAYDLSTMFDRRLLDSVDPTVPDSDCEFWAHKEFNDYVSWDMVPRHIVNSPSGLG